MKNKKEIQILSPEQLAELNAAYPVAEESMRVNLPRFGMLAKDITQEEGKGKTKTIKIIESAGTFYTEQDKGEVNDQGKKVWTKTYLGEEVEVIIAFHRRQLRLYDKGLNKFISSPIYDNKDQIIPLYLDKRQIAKGTQEELRARYPKLTEKGKKSSKLNEETILYILYEGELYQCNLSQSSKWSFKDYSKGVNPSTVITTLNSVEETNGSNTYRKITFKNTRIINSEEFELVKKAQEMLKTQVESDAQYFLENANVKSIEEKQNEELDNYGNEKMK